MIVWSGVIIHPYMIWWYSSCWLWWCRSGLGQVRCKTGEKWWWLWWEAKTQSEDPNSQKRTSKVGFRFRFEQSCTAVCAISTAMENIFLTELGWLSLRPGEESLWIFNPFSIFIMAGACKYMTDERSPKTEYALTCILLHNEKHRKNCESCQS